MEFPTPRALKQTLPNQHSSFIHKSRLAIQDILLGKDPRKLLIVGPCSIHNLHEGEIYAEKLQKLALELSGEFLIVMRAYVEKPRTTSGWRGLAIDPDLDGSCDMARGLFLSRQFLHTLAEKKIPAATEFVTPSFAPYFDDLISWGCIGARTCTSQIHRLLASYLPMPVGIKNSVEGSITCAENALEVAKAPQVFLHIDDERRLSPVQSSGNPFAHLVLRGGDNGPNYSKDILDRLKGPLVIDCSHGNSGKDPSKQQEVFHYFRDHPHPHVKGLMLESYLEGGAQSISETLKAGVSITDPCLDFLSTAELLYSSMMSTQS